MKAHRLDDTHLVPLFPMSLNGVTLRWFALVEPFRLRTWENVTHEFLTQFASSTSTDVSIQELEATKQRSNETISLFISRWRANVVDMIDWPKEEQIDMVLRNLQLRFARRLISVPFKDLKSLFQVEINVKDAIAQGLWSDDTSSHDVKGKKPVGPFNGRSREANSISYNQRPIHQLPYRSPNFRARSPTP